MISELRSRVVAAGNDLWEWFVTNPSPVHISTAVLGGIVTIQSLLQSGSSSSMLFNVFVFSLFVLFSGLSIAIHVDRSGGETNRAADFVTYGYAVALVILCFLFFLNNQPSTSTSGLLTFLYLLMIPLSVMLWVIRYLSKSNVCEVANGRANSKTLITPKWTSVAFVGIMLVYLSIKWEYLFTPLGAAAHSDKIGSYLPNSIYMVQAGDLFFNSNRSYVSLIGGDVSEYVSPFNTFPFFEWLYALLLPVLTPVVQVEVVVRAPLVVMGMILLGLIYSFCRRLMGAVIALVVTLFVAINPQFQLLTHITVMDLPALLFTFASLNMYIRDREYLAYLLAGFACMMKLSFVLVIIPALAVDILWKQQYKLYRLGSLGALGMGPVFVHKVLIEPIPVVSKIEGMLRLLFAVFVISAIYITFTQKGSEMKSFIEMIPHRYQYLTIAVSTGFVVIGFSDQISYYSKEFLTDKWLIFNAEMYSYLYSQKIIQFLPRPIHLLAFSGIAYGLIERRKRRYLLALIVGGVAYTVLAVKAIWIHAYYKHLLVIVPIVGFGYCLKQLMYIYEERGFALISIVLVAMLLTGASVGGATAQISGEFNGLEPTAEYLQEHTEPTEKIIRTDASTKLLHIYGASNPQVNIGGIPAEEARQLNEEVRQKGLARTLSAHGVNYYVSIGKGEFSAFEYMISVDSRDEVNFSVRRNIILRQIGQDTPYTRSGGSKVQYNISKHFELEEKFGVVYIYSVQPPENGTRSEDV